MKKVLWICAALLLMFTLPVSAEREIPAERQLPLLVDEADLLDSWEEEELLERLNEISERQECEVAIITVNSLNGAYASASADYLYDYYGYGYGENDDGILLLVSLGDSDWAISTYGFGIYAFTDAGQKYMADTFVPYLSDGDFNGGFTCFADLCDDFLTQAHNGAPFDIGSVPKKFNWVMILVGLGIGAIIALIIVAVMASKLKSVQRKNSAADYTRPGSFSVQYGNEMFLYHHVSRVRRESSSSSGGGSSTHRSSSGRIHGGSSGKF